MSDSTKVDIQELTKFGSKTVGIGPDGASDSGGSMANLTEALSRALGVIQTAAGAGAALGTNEAQTFNDWYNQAVVGSAVQCGEEMPRKIMAFGGTAVVMAANYAEADMSQAKAMNEVIDIFGTSPNKGIDGDLDKSGADQKYHTGVKPLPPVTKQKPVAKPPESPGDKASRQATEHQNKYGQDETWPKPPKEPKTKILAPGPIGQEPPSTGVTA